MKTIKEKISFDDLKKIAQNRFGKKKLHKGLTKKRWCSLSFYEQMSNIGSEVERAINWRKKGNKEYSYMAFERMLELLGMTISDQRNKKSLRELCRLREILIDYLWGNNLYQSKEAPTKNYFYAFNYLTRILNEK